MNRIASIEAWLDALPDSSSRREFLRRSAGLGALWVAGGAGPVARRLGLQADPFGLGVASGDPLPDGVVLWTRLVPEPLTEAGGMPPAAVQVRWEISSDERFTRVVRDGTVRADAAFGHAVHVEAGGLEPDREYWYRFIADGEASPVGRTRTAPATGAPVDELRFAVASCQHYEQGYYTALRHLSTEDVRFVVFLGDYIYEDGGIPGRPRLHDAAEIRTVGDYRRRYGLYKSDADLQAAHASAPWIITPDDHEVDNNFAGDHDEHGTDPVEFLLRRAAAYQAWYEHMPVRRAQAPDGPDARLFRRLSFGSLIDMHALDTRQHRTDQPCGDGTHPRCAGAYDEHASMMGNGQERWLSDGLRRSRASWNVLANQVAIAEIDNLPGDEASYSMDRWDGYVAARRRLLSTLAGQRSQPIVLTGDIHSNWVAELRRDFADPASAAVGVEFIATSLSSGGDGADTGDFGRRALSANPHIRFFNGQRGYIRCAVTPDAWRSEYRVLQYVTRPGSDVQTRASFVVEQGRPGVHEG